MVTDDAQWRNNVPKSCFGSLGINKVATRYTAGPPAGPTLSAHEPARYFLVERTA